jgi:hypothetical protein
LERSFHAIPQAVLRWGEHTIGASATAATARLGVEMSNRPASDQPV